MGAPAGNSSGFSLIEMLVAVVIIAFTLLALCAAMVNAVSANLGNELRNTAVRLTNQTAEVLLALPIDNIQSCGATADPHASNYNASYTYDSSNACLGIANDYQKYPGPEQSVKGFQQRFNIVWDVTSLSDNLIQVTITVAYRHREEHFENNAVIYKHRTL
jgi:prepilin-type N-terminal cleavage/methylation domain-containing protein